MIIHSKNEEAWRPRAPKVGDVIPFVPAAFVGYQDADDIPKCIKGTVVHVNEAHRHYTLRATIWGHSFCESFKY